MMNNILVGIFIGALYLVSNLLMFHFGRNVGRNEANLDTILEGKIDENNKDRA